MRLTAGARWDTHDLYPSTVVSPSAAVTISAPSGIDVHLGWGHYAQFPDLALLTSPFGGSRLLPERANHVSLAIERRLGNSARLRVEGWNRNDRDLLARPFFDFRIRNGVIQPVSAALFNSARGYSRGIQFVLQTRSANRLSGWTSYTLSYARQRESRLGIAYWADEDQRHLANTYLSYRLRPSLNLSGRWAYGSGEPIPGFLTVRDGLYYLAPQRNQVRLSSYQRLDFRANKSFTYDAWKLTLFGEIINATNRRNLRYLSFDGLNGATQRAFLTVDRVFPIVPVAGVTFEF
ncbi:MAG TPA: hypothetical protein VER03_01715 [Bryobacteraceae bacterium]|nr:hypothetical protein [Bryobacteraceae bacterium]